MCSAGRRETLTQSGIYMPNGRCSRTTYICDTSEIVEIFSHIYKFDERLLPSAGVATLDCKGVSAVSHLAKFGIVHGLAPAC